MHVGKAYRFSEVIKWTSAEFALLFVIALTPVLLDRVFGDGFINFPADVVTILGGVAAFVIAFKNSATYQRTCNASKTYAGISAESQSFGYEIKNYFRTTNEVNFKQIKEIQSDLIGQHFAWLTLLRYTLRKEKVWESLHDSGNEQYMNYYEIPERKTPLEDALQQYLSQKKIEIIWSKKKPLTYCLLSQLDVLQECLKKGIITEHGFSVMSSSIKTLNTLQNDCIEIKEYPYPRNFASATKYLLYLFVTTLPFGLVTHFDNYHKNWRAIPISMLIGWAFIYLYKVGESSSNPFEGGANDIPIGSISRDIEIEMRETLGESDLPDALKPVNDILM